ncbi:DUF5908 family protein [Ohtaekwangia koreensis]|uniref:Uncharacterized protein n=1 Tax=Ohtaekwangia koreensis TaxID=688867 RepID=A0A1T5KRT1_9BACT|nr:DUF5908 family protein [Ohtaekwangia koreensis]SKC66387.1 hypothetical protein SAMN05660236_2533 [Ohtaekwangia koreensis]
MPVQINEVIIRAVVDAPGNGNSPSSQSSAQSSNTDGDSDAEIAERILEIIREKLER